MYWPVTSGPDEYGIAALQQAFRALGFADCDSGEQEPGHEKIALYGSTLLYTHVARQLPTGKWTSKLGRSEDIEHDSPDDLFGGAYGDVVQFMKRQIQPS